MRILTAFLLCFLLSSCWMVRAYRIRNMRLTDHQKLPSVRINQPDTAYYFVNAGTQASYLPLHQYLDSNLENSRTAAFLVIRNDSLVYEKYFDGFSGDQLLPSNSMAKSFVGTLAGIAYHERKIKSLSDPMTMYIPELLDRDSAFSKITIQHLLDMRSGFKFNEGSYDLKDDAIRLGLRPKLKKNLLKIRIAEPPGRFRYQSINTQFLGWIIERATGRSLQQYLEEKLWKPFGAEHYATWNVDSRKNKRALASAGLNAIARDFAKLGQLYVNKGNWNGKQLVPEDWINTVSSIDTMNKYGGYKYQWWSRNISQEFEDSLDAIAFSSGIPHVSSLRKNNENFRVSYRTRAFSAIGFLNQYIYVNPGKKLVIVRIGRAWRHPEMFSTRFIYQLGERL